jgi:hypothetical protein
MKITADTGATTLAGMFYGLVNGENNTLTIAGNMTADSLKSSGTLTGHSYNTGAAAVTVSNSTTEIGGEINATANGQIILAGMMRGPVNEENNTLTVAEDMTAYSKTSRSYLIGHSYGSGGVNVNNSTTEIGGSIKSTAAATANLMGMFYGVVNGENNTLAVSENMEALSSTADALLVGHFYGVADNLNNSTTDVGGVITSVSDEGSAFVYGMAFGEVKENSGNKVIVRNSGGDSDGMYAQTNALEKAASIEGYGLTAAGSPTAASNNSVYVNGSMTAKAPEIADVAGWTYALLLPDSVISDNIIFVNGKMQSLAEDITAGEALAAGFITASNQTVTNNSVYARDGIWTDTQTGSGIPAGFMIEAGEGAQIHNNTWLDRPGEYVQPEESTAARADYRSFIFAAGDSEAVAGNF